MSMFKRDDPETRRAEREGESRLGMNQRTLSIIGLVVIVGILVVLFVLPRLGGGDEDIADVDRDRDADVIGVPDNDPDVAVLDDDVDLGRPVAAADVDRDGCAIDTVSTFDTVDDIYVVAPDSQVPEGTQVFVRLYHEDQVLEDAPEIIANQDYTNTCINFVFEPVNGAFEPGNYEAEFFVNGNVYDTVDFRVD